MSRTNMLRRSFALSHYNKINMFSIPSSRPKACRSPAKSLMKFPKRSIWRENQLEKHVNKRLEKSPELYNWSTRCRLYQARGLKLK